MADRVYLYDSTLRDGAQMRGVDFTPVDKQHVSELMDSLGIDYIEGGWPGANPTDDTFFANKPKLKRSKLVAFGMTRRPGVSADNDPGLNALINSGAGRACIVGKSWDFQVKAALEISNEENLAMVSDSVRYLSSRLEEVAFDCEHFFDGYKANPQYALSVAKAAYDAGARWVVLCDTNGGTLPFEVESIVVEVSKTIPGSHLGIHCHNDTENAVANSLAAVKAGARQIQGTLNGLGERCGNANLVAIIPTLMLKMGYDVGIGEEGLKQISAVSHALDDRLNRPRNTHAAYVGSAAFAHKGGLHVSAVLKNPSSYEHIDPAKVGNERSILVSDQAGRSNVLSRLRGIGLEVDMTKPADKAKLDRLIEEIKERESIGYAYDGADASFELLARRFLSDVPTYYELRSFRVLDERRWNAKGELITLSEATIKLMLNGEEIMTVAEGNGPVNALDKALRNALAPKYKQLSDITLTDFRVRIISPELATRAVTRVWIESSDNKGRSWVTVGVSPNIIDASYNALQDAIIYRLLCV